MFVTSKMIVMAGIIVTLAAINTAWSVWTLSQRPPVTSRGRAINPHELTVNAKGLPTTKFGDYTFVFD